jgi:hypothetical protein
MTGNLENRLRRLEQASGAAGRYICMHCNEGEDADAILRANGIERMPADLVVRVSRFRFDEGDTAPPFSERIYSITPMKG